MWPQPFPDASALFTSEHESPEPRFGAFVFARLRFPIRCLSWKDSGLLAFVLTGLSWDRSALLRAERASARRRQEFCRRARRACQELLAVENALSAVFQDDIPRIEHPSGSRDWSAESVARQKAALEDFEKQWKQIDPSGWRGSASRLSPDRFRARPRALGTGDQSAMAAGSMFYLDQTMTALLEALVQPPPFNAVRSQEIVERMQAIPAIWNRGKRTFSPCVLSPRWRLRT